jgi:lipoprotein signal peptidase
LFGFGNPQGEENAILAFFRSMLSYLEDADHGLNTLFAIISLLAIGFIVVWASRPLVAQDRFLSIALGLILGGTLGNLYDRVVFSGVRDFLHCYYDTHIWPDFNIADCCLVCGASVLLVHSFLVGEKNPQPSPTEATAQTAPPLQTAAPANGV